MKLYWVMTDKLSRFGLDLNGNHAQRTGNNIPCVINMEDKDIFWIGFKNGYDFQKACE